MPGSFSTSVAVSPAGTAQWSMPRMRHQPTARSLSSTAASIVGLYAKPMRRTRHVTSSQATATAALIRSSSSAHRGAARSQAGGTRGSLPAPGSATRSRPGSQGRAAAPPRPSPGAPGRAPRGPARRHPSASARPASNCGLTSATIDPPPSRSTDRTGPSTRASEMNATSITARSTGSGSSAGEGPGVDPLHGHHARVLAQLLGQLAVADVHRVHPGGAPGEEHIGEAAGRGADIDGHAAGRVDPERVEGGDQLVRSPAGPLPPAGHRDARPAVHEIARLEVPSGRIALRQRGRGRRAPGPAPASGWARARAPRGAGRVGRVSRWLPA